MTEFERFRRDFASLPDEQLEVIANSSPSKSDEHTAAYFVLLERRRKQKEGALQKNELPLRTHLQSNEITFYLTWGICAATMGITVGGLIIWVVFF